MRSCWRSAGRFEKVGEDRLPFATMYVTLEPCAQCAGALVLAKVGAWSSERMTPGAGWRARCTICSAIPG